MLRTLQLILVLNMGIPIIPGPTFCNSCSFCFPANATPAVVIASIGGVVKLPGSSPLYPQPPNGIYVLYDQGDCTWQGVGPYPWTCIWWANDSDRSRLVAVRGSAFYGFVGSTDPCGVFFENVMHPGIDLYYNGNAVIMCTKTFSPTSESQHIANLLTLEQDIHTKFEFWPIDASRRSVRMARYMKQASIQTIINTDCWLTYNVTGTLTPDATCNSIGESEWKDKAYYARTDRLFFIWWDGIDSWIISYCVGWTDKEYWKRTDPNIVGEYAPFNGAIGTATVSLGEH